MLRKASLIGDDVLAWSQAMLVNRGIPGTRVLNGLLNLPKAYPAKDINLGCNRALTAGAFTLRELKNHIAIAGTQQQMQLPFTEVHELIRDIETYEQAYNTRELFI